MIRYHKISNPKLVLQNRLVSQNRGRKIDIDVGGAYGDAHMPNWPH